jgi:hypothetical protein
LGMKRAWGKPHADLPPRDYMAAAIGKLGTTPQDRLETRFIAAISEVFR